MASFERLLDGLVIPAHPLALTADGKLDERRQRALSRYYLAAGAGGLAVGVHTTQFAIHRPEVGLYQPVLELAAEEAARADAEPVLVAGVVGSTDAAVREAGLARDLGFQCTLVSLGAFAEATEDAMLDHVRTIAGVLPVFGFYLQPAVGGRILSYNFWRRFSEIDGVVAVKIAPFNRYQTLDVVRAVLDSGRGDEIALYTGNDDAIVVDLLTTFRFRDGRVSANEARIVGGLLGQWAVWTRRAVELLGEIKRARANERIPAELLTRAAQITDANAAIFDPQHNFAGCIPGIHEILRRQGILSNIRTLDSDERLSPGQMAEIDRVCRTYPHLTDDEFVREHLDEWLR